MSIAGIATEFILSDSLIREEHDSRAKGLRLELPTDRMIKFISVGLPLLLVSAALAKEISLRESQSARGHTEWIIDPLLTHGPWLANGQLEVNSSRLVNSV